MVESQDICFLRRMSAIEVRQWPTKTEDVFTEILPYLYETNVDRCVSGRTAVHIFPSAFFAVFVLWFIYC